jgi:hypothetical protein
MTTQHDIQPNLPNAGQTKYDFTLRNDLLWHDGQPVTGRDVCFSILSDKQAPSANFFPSVAAVASCTVSGNIVTVVINGISPFDELNLGGVFIVPEHIWASVCGGLQAGTDACVTPANLASTATDYVSLGYMVGSGPFICNSSQGVSTIPGQTSCTQSAAGVAGGQALSTGGRIFLKRNLAYDRCCPNTQTPNAGLHLKTTSLQAYEFSDFKKTGKVDLTDILSATGVFGQGCTTAVTCYFASPIYSSGDQRLCNAGQTAPCIDVSVILTMTGYYGHGLTGPFTGTNNGFLSAAAPAGLVNYDPNLDTYVVRDTTRAQLGYFQGCQRLADVLVAPGPPPVFMHRIQCTVSGTLTNAATLTGPLAGSSTTDNANAVGSTPAGFTTWTFSRTDPATYPSGFYQFTISGTVFTIPANLP